ncbi:MAG TPA: hypothetical protein VFJ15_02785 [Oleiagrimonas sp.]|nr:hypothetical protein [Oleiagrimonas sp.]
MKKNRSKFAMVALCLFLCVVNSSYGRSLLRAESDRHELHVKVIKYAPLSVIGISSESMSVDARPVLGPKLVYRSNFIGLIVVSSGKITSDTNRCYHFVIKEIFKSSAKRYHGCSSLNLSIGSEYLVFGGGEDLWIREALPVNKTNISCLRHNAEDMSCVARIVFLANYSNDHVAVIVPGEAVRSDSNVVRTSHGNIKIYSRAYYLYRDVSSYLKHTISKQNNDLPIK